MWVIALDFTKAFDTVRHYTLLHKMANIGIPDSVYNWLVSYFCNHSHCTKYGGEVSSMLDITAGIIQGSGIGPASYVINAGDLRTISSCNYLFKYADDTYIITPSANADSRTAEFTNIEDWACSNNLKLNRSKSVEIIITRQRRKCHVSLMPTLPDIARVQTIKILGVTISHRLSVNQHVTNIIASTHYGFYELMVWTMMHSIPFSRQLL